MTDELEEAHSAHSENSFTALMLAYTAATSALKEDELNWETLEGLPAWIVIPKTVPISWGFDFYSRIVHYIDQLEMELNERLERRQRES